MPAMETNMIRNVENIGIFPAIRQYVVKLNAYRDAESLSITEQLIATRLNLSLLIVCLFTLLIIRGFTLQTEMMIIPSPSENQFQQLSKEHPSTLSCPCSQVNIPYKSFLSFSPEFHQVCSSSFISQSWISALFSNYTNQYHPLDFRVAAFSQFQILRFLCRIASNSASNALFEFGIKKLMNTHVLSLAAFDAQNMALIQNLRTTTIAGVLRMDRLLGLNIAYNHIKSSLLTNYFVYSVPGQRFYTTYVGVYLSPDYKNMSDILDYCSCEGGYTCRFPSGIYQPMIKTSNFYNPYPPPNYTVPGIFSGCIPRFSLSQSTLECLYDFNCLNNLALFGIDTSSQQLLNASILSRFSINATVESMFNELFIEEWHDQSNFTAYFQACAPFVCSYTYTQRLNAIYMILSMIGLLGGLIMACHFFAFFFVQYIIHRILKKYYPHLLIHQEDVQQVTVRNFRQLIIGYLNQFWHRLRVLNIYDNSIVLSELKEKIWATRICLFLLFIGVLILTIYSSVIPRTTSVTIMNPSQDQFEDIYAKYPSTLSCPCTRLSTSYSTMISIQPRYHQICTSDFIQEDKWLLYFRMIPYVIPIQNYTYFSQDFRFNAGSSLFRIMRTLCQFANETVTNALLIFNSTQFVSAEPLTAKIFNTQISTITTEFERQTLDSYLSLFSLIRSAIEDNQFHISIDTNIGYISYVINNSWSVRLRPRPFPLMSNNNETCNCLISNQCIRPQGFYCRNSLCYRPTSLPNQTIPGLVVSCFPVSSLLLSTLECFYNRSCIQMLYDWRLFEIDDIYYPLTLNVTPLDPNIPSRFSLTTKLESIISRLLLEEWIITTNNSAHYQQCNPEICTYTYTVRFETIYVITTVIGLFGGLYIILRLSIPFIIHLPFQKFIKRKIRHLQQSNQIQDHCHQPVAPRQSLVIRVKQSITSIDIFETQLDNSIWATRVYIVCFWMVFVIISVFTAIISEVQSETIRLPSESTFELLHQQHTIDSISCPCRQSSIPYKTFLNLAVYSHQVCSSDFVSSTWWKLIASRGDETFLLFDQPLLSNHFRMLSSLCKASQQTVNNSIDAFVSTSLISVESLTRSAFINQIESTLSVFIAQTPLSFVETLEYISNTFRSNQLEHLFLSDWMLSFTTAQDNYILATIPSSYNNGTCTCATSLLNECWWPLVIRLLNTTNITLPGLIGGCLPIDGLRQSTLECLFDSVCLSIFPLFITNTNISMIPAPLNANLPTRFPYSTTKIGTLIDHLFVEEWLNTSNYSAYYELCSPHACYYTYTTRLNILYKITSILGLYGGTTISLRFIVAYAFRIINRMRYWWHQRH